MFSSDGQSTEKCNVCAEPLSQTGRRGHPAFYCSPECRAAAELARKLTRMLTDIIERQPRAGRCRQRARAAVVGHLRMNVHDLSHDPDAKPSA